MKLHRNAALSLKKRELLGSRVVDRNWSLIEAAEAAEVSERRAGEWVRRYRAEGELGLLNRSSAPKHVHNRTDEARVQVIAALRRLRMTGAEIGEVLGMPSTSRSSAASKVVPASEPATACTATTPRPEPIAPGVRRKTVGWEYVRVCVDDAARLAYVEVLGDERAPTAVGFLGRAVRFFRRHGIRVERVITDNGSAYRSTIHALACRILGIRHLRTRTYRPQTNGKAERFIRTMLGGWAYGAIDGSSAERTVALDGWLWRYNHERPHGSLGRKPPPARLAELNNVLGSYS